MKLSGGFTCFSGSYSNRNCKGLKGGRAVIQATCGTDGICPPCATLPGSIGAETSAALFYPKSCVGT